MESIDLRVLNYTLNNYTLMCTLLHVWKDVMSYSQAWSSMLIQMLSTYDLGEVTDVHITIYGICI